MTMGNDLKEIVGDGTAEASFATIDENGIDVDGDQVLIKVTCHPSGSPRTVRLGADYAGPEFGIWTLPKVGDELLCVFPRDAGIGAVLKRMANSIDKIPADLRDQAEKNPVLIIHPSGWKVLGTDDAIEIDATDVPITVRADSVTVEATNVLVTSGDVKLGDTSAVALCRKELYDWVTGTFLSAYSSHNHLGNLGAPTSIPMGSPVLGPSNATTTKVKGT